MVIVERQNGYSVVELEAEGIHRVIDYNDILKVSIFDYPQVFNVHAFFRLHARISVNSVLNEFVVRVKEVKDHVGVSLVRRSEDHHLEVLTGLS